MSLWKQFCDHIQASGRQPGRLCVLWLALTTTCLLAFCLQGTQQLSCLFEAVCGRTASSALECRTPDEFVLKFTIIVALYIIHIYGRGPIILLLMSRIEGRLKKHLIIKTTNNSAHTSEQGYAIVLLSTVQTHTTTRPALAHGMQLPLIGQILLTLYMRLKHPRPCWQCR